MKSLDELFPLEGDELLDVEIDRHIHPPPIVSGAVIGLAGLAAAYKLFKYLHPRGNPAPFDDE